uniref:Ig-like domain-containing protein n=1 Tax=Macrostomum lignano TaxID=282301 RepID=A0A1I8HAW8_9PLAT
RGGGTRPQFTTKPSIKQRGKSIVFECNLLADPLPDITWSKAGQTIENSDRYAITCQSSGQNHLLSLEIKGVTANDGGEYKVSGKPPKFLEKPSIAQVGDNIEMKCVIEAQPMPRITWFRGDSQISTGGKITISCDPGPQPDSYVLLLVIRSPGPDDSGSYRCNVVNEAGESNASLTLNMSQAPQPSGTPPNFIEKPRIEREGDNIRITCICKGDPAPTFTWYRGESVMTSGGRYSISSTNSGIEYTLVLLISNFTAEDGGQYRIVAKSGLGEANATVSINTQMQQPEQQQEPPPQLVGKPQIKVQNNGRVVVIEIRVKSLNRPEAKWTHEGVAIGNGGRYFMDMTRDGDSYVVVLEIDELNNSDNGMYNSPQTKPGEAPKVVTPLSAATGQVSECVEFRAQISGSEPVSVEWRVAGRKVSTSRNYQLVYASGVATLRLLRLTKADQGEVTVEFSNAFGKTSSSARLTVEEPPKPKKPEEDEKQEPKSDKEKLIEDFLSVLDEPSVEQDADGPAAEESIGQTKSGAQHSAPPKSQQKEEPIGKKNAAPKESAPPQAVEEAVDKAYAPPRYSAKPLPEYVEMDRKKAEEEDGEPKSSHRCA